MRLGHLPAGDGGLKLFAELDGRRVIVDDVLEGAPATLDELIRMPEWLPRVRSAAADGPRFDRSEERLASALLAPSAIIAIGLNYHDHCREFGQTPPKTPIVFAKFPTSLAGHGDDVVWSTDVTDQVDWEAELAVVIGKPARNVSKADALDYVFGYTAVNDVTARDIQGDEQQWVRAKSLATFCPLGPVVVTADEIADPGALPIRSFVNGEQMQNSSTAELIFDVPDLIAYLSRSFTLRPGDVICTGTPFGVGAFRTPPVFLRDGDEVTVEIDGIGALTNRCRVVAAAQQEAA
jgi:2-keto-4-pentenoate hydratase/2-oxohepta-3-ene-1,7-dioic acid hydratase in catechol pathway